jgi:hypothetical protein
MSSSILSATSSWRNSTRNAEQRWPALSKADAITSRVTCSGNAVESTIIAFWPPVSAISVASGPVARGERAVDGPGRFGRTRECHARARIAEQRVADPRTVARKKMQHVPGTPASCISLTAAAAISGVCSAGFASTALPAASAPATWPVKIASGKFHGEMQAKTPRPCSDSSFSSPVGPGKPPGFEQRARALGIIAQEIDRFAHFAQRIGQRLARLAHGQRHQMRAVLLEQIGGAFEDVARARSARRSQL